MFDTPSFAERLCCLDVKLNWLVLGENNENPSNPTPIKSKNIQNTSSSEVEKIILLLKDGTFKTFEN